MKHLGGDRLAGISPGGVRLVLVAIALQAAAPALVVESHSAIPDASRDHIKAKTAGMTNRRMDIGLSESPGENDVSDHVPDELRRGE